MNNIAIAAVLLVVSTACVAQTKVVSSNFLKASAPFTTTGKISHEEMDLGKRIDVNKIEQGVLNGVHYKLYYSDGSGTFAGSKNGEVAAPGNFEMGADWSVACEKDAMTDKKTCTLNRKHLYITVNSRGHISIFIVGSDEQYPGTRVTVRIDSHQAIHSPSGSNGSFTNSQSMEILRQLKSSSKVTTRFEGWPYGNNEDTSFNLNGFPEAYEYIWWAVKRIE